MKAGLYGRACWYHAELGDGINVYGGPLIRWIDDMNVQVCSVAGQRCPVTARRQ